MQVQSAIQGSSLSAASISEGVEASVIYVRFKAASGEVVSGIVLAINFFLWEMFLVVWFCLR